MRDITSTTASPPIKVVACPHPLRAERVARDLYRPQSLAEILAEVQPDGFLRRHAHIYVNGEYIRPEDYATTYPPPGSEIYIKTVPRGPLVGVVVALAALVTAVAVKAALIGVVGAFWATVIGAAAGLFVSVMGTLILRALIPPPHARGQMDLRKDPQVYFLEAARNELRPYGIVPCVLGTHRMVPPLAARPYTEAVGDQQYLRFVVLWGYGPVSLTDLRIGETPLSEFDDVEVEHRYGYENDPPLTLYTQDIYEEGLDILLKQSQGWQTRTTQPDTEEISVDITCHKGLFGVNDNGNKVKRTVRVEIEYRTYPSGTWLPVTALVVTAASMSAVRRGHRWTVTKGQYDVRLRRTTPDNNSARISDEVSWTALRSIKSSYPFNLPCPMALTAVRIRASEQLHGMVDQLNGVVSKIVLDWDKNSQTWVQRASSNPASIYRWILQGPANHRPLPDSQIDLVRLQEWHEFCEAKGFKYDTVKDWEGDVEEILAQVAAAGRASPTIVDDGKRSVIWDDVQDLVVQTFTPRNSWDFEAEKQFADVPHALRCRFVNAQQGYRQDERIVYRDGYNENNATLFETLEMPGITDPDHVWKLARYHLACALLRPEVFRFKADFEHILCQRGDLIRVQHDVPLWGLSAGRVVEVLTDQSGYWSGLQVDEICPMEAGKTYNLRVRKQDGTQILKQVVTQAGEQRTLTLSQPVPPGQPWPQAGDLWMFGEMGLETVPLLVKSIEPGSDLTATITAVEYNPAIYDADSGTIPPFESKLSPPPEWWTPEVVDIRSDGSVLYLTPDKTWASRILVTYKLHTSIFQEVSRVEAQWWRVDDMDPAPPQVISVPYEQGEVSLMPVESGATYGFRLRHIYLDGRYGPWSTTYQHTVQGKEWPPADVTGLQVTQSKQFVQVFWQPVPDLDVKGYEVRYGPVGCNWDDANTIIYTMSGTSIMTSMVPPGEWDILVKAEDTSGNWSVNPARRKILVVTFYQILADVQYDPAWTGVIGGFLRNPATGHLNPKDLSLASGNDFQVFDKYVVSPYPVYYAAIFPVGDLGEIKAGRAWYRYSYAAGPGENLTGVGPVRLRMSDDGINWSEWQDWTIGPFSGRYYQWGIRQYIDNGLVCIESFEIIIDKEL